MQTPCQAKEFGTENQFVSIPIDVKVIIVVKDCHKPGFKVKTVLNCIQGVCIDVNLRSI